MPKQTASFFGGDPGEIMLEPALCPCGKPADVGGLCWVCYDCEMDARLNADAEQYPEDYEYAAD